MGQGHGWGHSWRHPSFSIQRRLLEQNTGACMEGGQGFGGRGRGQLQRPPAEPCLLPTLPQAKDCFSQTQAQPLSNPAPNTQIPPPSTSELCRHQACRFPPQQDPVHWPQRLKRRWGGGAAPGKVPQGAQRRLVLLPRADPRWGTEVSQPITCAREQERVRCCEHRAGSTCARHTGAAGMRRSKHGTWGPMPALGTLPHH